jgi:fucose 4-O-acetylase-like acetyltransferase
VSVDRSESSGRVRYLDIARGLGVLAVVLQHNDYLIRAGAGRINDLLSFRLPLLFFVSGVFISTARSFTECASIRTHAILKPYLVVAGSLIVLCALGWTLQDASPSQLLVGFAYGTGGGIPWPWVPIWFLPCLWLSTLVARAAWSQLRVDSLTWSALAGVMILLLLLTAAILPVMRSGLGVPGELSSVDATVHSLPLSLDLLPLACCFVLMGMRLRKHVFSFRPRIIDTSLAIALLLTAYSFPAYHIDLNMREYHLVGSTLLALSGIYLALAAAYVLATIPIASRVFATLGEASLFVLLFHAFVLEHVSGVLGVTAVHGTVTICVVSTMLACAVPVGAWVLARLFPWFGFFFFAPRRQ